MWVGRWLAGWVGEGCARSNGLLGGTVSDLAVRSDIAYIQRFRHDQRIARFSSAVFSHPAVAMAPKARESALKAHVAERVGSDRVSLADLSLEDDSVWRALEASHVEELKTKILEGEYGQTTMSTPTVLVDQNDSPIVSVVDGKIILDNGKHFISALVSIGEVYDEIKTTLLEQAAAASPPAEEIAEASWPEWLVPPLRRVFEEGLLMDFLRYPTDDRLAQSAMQCLSHESEQNRYRVSTVKDRVSIVKKAYAVTSDWVKTKKTLLDLFGLSRNSTVQRWGVVAKGDGWRGVGAGWEARHPKFGGLPQASPNSWLAPQELVVCLPMLAACPHPQSCGLSPQAGGPVPPKLAACPRQCTFCRNSLAFLISLAPRAPLHPPPPTPHAQPLEVDHVGA